MAEFEDPEMTPKPLRIAKRGGRRKSEYYNTSQALSLSAQRAIVPQRTSSISSSCTRSDLPQQDHTSQASQWTGKNASLALDQQRQSNPTTAADTKSGLPRSFSSSATFEPRAHPRARGIFRMLDSRTEHSAADVKSRIAARSTAIRAFSTGTFTNPINDEGPHPVPPIPLVTQRRVVTDAVPTSTQGEATKRYHGLALRRESSFGKGFITRMMGNIAHRSHNSPTTAIAQDTSQHRSKEVLGAHAPILETTEPLGRISESSKETDISNDSDLGHALAAFPTPPTSSDTSPRPSETIPISPPASQRHRILRTPEDACIMGAELKLTAECDELTSDGGNSILVAVDIEGAMNSTANGQDLWSQHIGLDVVVVIDNSLYISPSTLMASCEVTRALASILNVVTDRLGVLCTSPINDHRTLGSDFTKIWPLSRIKVRKLKTVLDAIVNTKEKPSPCSWADTIKVATETLSKSPVPDPDSELLQDTFGHVIVLTTNAKGLSSTLFAHENIQFHVVCPASVPLNDFDTVICNGWKLRSICGNEQSAVKNQRNIEPTTLLSRLRCLIIHARSGKDAGKLNFLCLDIKAGPDCSIQSVMGEDNYLTLHPGELRTLLVRLKVHAPRARRDPLASSTTLPEFGPESGVVLKELDKMLEVVPRPTKLLSARLKYKHSLLPVGTTCSIRSDCRVMRQTSYADSKAHSGRLFAGGTPECAIVVDERLAYYLATHASPRHALTALSTQFGEEGQRSHRPDYTRAILKELKYQARILERLEIDASPRKLLLSLQTNVSSSRSGSEYFSARSLQGSGSYKLERYFMEVPDDEACSPSSQRVLVVSERDRKAMIRSNSENTSRGPPLSIRGRTASLKHDGQRNENEGHLAIAPHKRSESQPTVLRNKASDRALAIRRLNSVGESVGK